jgi:hypothetical protein
MHTSDPVTGLPPVMHTAFTPNACLSCTQHCCAKKLLPVVHTAFSNKCLACQEYTKSCHNNSSCHAHSISSKCSPIMHFSTGVPNNATRGAHSTPQQMSSLSCIHQVLLKVSPCHAPSMYSKRFMSCLRLCVPYTDISGTHNIFLQLFSLSCIHQALSK